MAPRLRGERSTDALRIQAARQPFRCGLCPQGVSRSPGPACGRAAIGSEP